MIWCNQDYYSELPVELKMDEYKPLTILFIPNLMHCDWLSSFASACD